ncbi:MAG TPA: alpha/beta fold hydrolase [Kofleriaceae bacterium]|nr:alpha/beta fold hydrolase [Kofleriaceae bacterium]
MVTSVSQQTAPLAPPVGEGVVGDYALVRRIGRGAMGEVWLARHTRTGGIAAIKVLRDGTARNRERLRRFFARERRAVARLSHANIVPLFELGPDYIAMRYIDGPTLARRLATPIEPVAALDIAVQIASALAHAHARDVIHRDVKPSNILLDTMGNAYLADFGLAALLDDADAGDERGGTPQYMAPEQTRGDTPSPAADQFALGCVLAEMLAGGRVQADPDAVASALPQTLPRRLVDIIRQAIDPDPAKRWPSVGSFAIALRGLDVASSPVPQRLLPELRVSGPFAWAAHQDAFTELAPSISRADYRLSALEAKGAISPAAARAFRERTGYADFGWSVVGRTDRLGAITDPRAYARAGEAVVMIHGGFATRESWISVATPVAQGNGQTLVFIPDLSGYGVSRYQERRPAQQQVSPQGSLDGVLAWMELIGVRELPLVLVGHSLGATALMTASDDALGARTWRVAVAPVFPAVDWRQRWGLRLAPAMGLSLAWIPGVKRLVANMTFQLAPAARAYEPEERQRMLEAFMALPAPTLIRSSRQYSYARPAPSTELARCVVVLSENDPVAPMQRMLRALAELEFPEHQIHRLVSQGHLPHGQTAINPEWTQRNIVELAAIIDQLLVAAREGSVLPTQVASTLMSDGTSTESA